MQDPSPLTEEYMCSILCSHLSPHALWGGLRLRVACVLVDHLPLKLELQRDPDLAGRRVLVFQRQGSQRTVLDASPAAAQVTRGMSLQEAQTHCKDAVLIEADVLRYQQAFDSVLLSLGEWSPDVESGQLGCAYVGLDGLEETYGTEDRLIDALLQSVQRHLEPRVGVSHGKFPAYLAALRAEPGRAYKPPLGVKQFVAPFPIEVLPVPWNIKARLRSFGLDTLEKVAKLSLGPLQAQFGSAGARIWHLAQGKDDTPLVRRQLEEEVTSSIAFPMPTANIEPLLMALDHLSARLFSQPEMWGRYARVALLEGQIVMKPAWQRRIVFKVPVGERGRAYFVLKSLVADVVLPGPLEEVRLTLKELTGESGRQESLFRDVRRRDQLRETVAQLKVAQGRNPIYQVREVEPWSRIPERQRALVTYEP